MENNCESDEHLLSLLRIPLMPSEETVSSSSDIMVPMCASSFFEEPFDNTDMEPLPFSSHSPSIIQPEPVSSLAPFKSSFQKETEGLDLGRSLASFLFNPIDNDILQSKRSFDELLSEICVPSHSNKRQRTSSSPCSEDETALRFRPYQDRLWRAMFKKLIQYKLQNGHCSVPHAYLAEPKLARWVKRQRFQHKKFECKDPTSTMTAVRIEELNSIGFVWQSHASAWQTKFNELKAFQEVEGRCNVPSNYQKNLPLAAWIRCQRRHCRLWRSGSSSTTMTAERYELLASLGFPFETTTHQPM